MRFVLKRPVLAGAIIAALVSCRRAPRDEQEASSAKGASSASAISTAPSSGSASSSARDTSGSGGSGARPGPSATDEASEQIKRYEKQAAERDATRSCERPLEVYEGSIDVARNDYVHSVPRGDDFVDVPIDGLDKAVAKSKRVRFTLDYPFERPFTGAVEGAITLRRTIDAVRAGFRQMYKSSTQRDIPGMYNKDVTGPYGRSFHGIDDLVIERIELCADDTFQITIGS